MKPNYKTCPYNNFQREAYWSKAVANIAPNTLDPCSHVNFTIDAETKISTAGSCFAQHIARYLKQNGFNYFVPESAPTKFKNEVSSKYGFGVFSGRFGNIYTARQLLQLFQRSYSEFHPASEYWVNENGRYVDPFRPTVTPNGFVSLAELYSDRASHFRSFRKIIESSDIFVFTLGLTEAWKSKMDGAIYPVCPGCGYGEFDENKYEFINFNVAEVVSDLSSFIQKARQKNERLKFIFTVSPVPLIATAENRHVLSSTVYSKSVLRAAAQEVVDKVADTMYFPSYEIVTSPSNRGSYFADDLRTIREEGVKHVMTIFMKHLANRSISAHSNEKKLANLEHKRIFHHNDVTEVLCDEELLVLGESYE